MQTTKPLSVCVESFNDEAGYVAWIDNEKFKGMVVQANTMQGALKELLISLTVKFAYDYGITVGGAEEKLQDMIKQVTECKDEKKQIKLMFA